MTDTNLFDQVWAEYIKPMSGKTIRNEYGLSAKVLNVTDDYVEKLSHTGKVTRVSKEMFRWIADNIRANGTANTADLRNCFCAIDASSFVTLVYANIPLFDVHYNPRTIRLKEAA